MSHSDKARFRAIVDSASPKADAEALRKNGFELLGPWAAGNASAERLVEDEHEVTALLGADSPAAAADAVGAVVGADAIVEIVPVESEPGTRRASRGGHAVARPLEEKPIPAPPSE